MKWKEALSLKEDIALALFNFAKSQFIFPLFKQIGEVDQYKMVPFLV